MGLTGKIVAAGLAGVAAVAALAYWVYKKYTRGGTLAEDELRTHYETGINVQIKKFGRCSICMEEITSRYLHHTVNDMTFSKIFTERIVLPYCGHQFHETCIRAWVFDHENSTCPTCRTDVFVYDDDEEDAG